MSGTYKATGINLKSMAFGESDRLITVLTREYGLIRAIAPGSRKHQSSLRGRSGLFVINDLLIAKGRNLDKIIQAEGLESFTGLSHDLQKLTASQYIAELALYQALSDQPQEELFLLLRNSLSRLEQLPTAQTLPYLTHATFQLLKLAGVAPEVQACCVTQMLLEPDWSDPAWRIGFSITAGGTVTLAELDRLTAMPPTFAPRVAESGSAYTAPKTAQKPVAPNLQIDVAELALLQQLADFDADSLPDLNQPPPDDPIWLGIERLLRQCAEFYFERPIRSAALIDTCFQVPQPLSS